MNNPNLYLLIEGWSYNQTVDLNLFREVIVSFVLYSTTWCGYCKRLKRQLTDLGIVFEEINIEEVVDAAQIVERINNGNRTVPTLVFSDGSSMTNPSASQVSEKLSSLS